mgnify:CR=1 FL=1
MSKVVSKSFIFTKEKQGPDVARYVWLLFTGLSLLGSSLFVLLMGH